MSTRVGSAGLALTKGITPAGTGKAGQAQDVVWSILGHTYWLKAECDGCFIFETLGRVDGFDQDEAESKRDERAVILRRLLASKCDTLEAFELADRLFDACPCLVERFRKEVGHILGVGSIRDCRTYSALARGVAV